MSYNFGTILQHTVFDVALPTVDTYSDINFAVAAFSTGNVGIGFLMTTPVVINFLLSVCKWKTTSFDDKKEKRFSWLFLILNFWPQYQVSKLIFVIVTKKPEEYWKKMQQKIKMEISYLEPFVEAIPQYFISVGVYGMLSARNFVNYTEGSPFTNVFFPAT